MDPQNSKFAWGIDGNAQDWKGETPNTAHEGERLVYRPLSKIKDYVSLQVLLGERAPMRKLSNK